MKIERLKQKWLRKLRGTESWKTGSGWETKSLKSWDWGAVELDKWIKKNNKTGRNENWNPEK